MHTLRLLILSCCLSSSIVFAGDINWHDTQELIDNHFPEAPVMTTQQLADMLENKQQPVLVDVRAPREHEVSHLSGAVNVTSISELNKLKLDKNTHVVFYCSVGYRSADMTEQAIEEGYVNAVNLKGSIFQWANEGRVVYSGEMPVEKVHPFNSEWGQLLNEKYRSQ